MIQLVTDSAVMLSCGITIVPLTITIDGEDIAGRHRSLSRWVTYRRRRRGVHRRAVVGRIRRHLPGRNRAYVTVMLSLHTSAAYSETVASAIVTAKMVDFPVSIIDTGAGSFPVALTAWASAEARPRQAVMTAPSRCGLAGWLFGIIVVRPRFEKVVAPAISTG